MREGGYEPYGSNDYYNRPALCAGDGRLRVDADLHALRHRLTDNPAQEESIP